MFDGELLQRNLQAFLARVNTASIGSVEALPNHEITDIEVSMAIDAGLNISFAGIGGNLDRNRTFTFALKPRSEQ